MNQPNSMYTVHIFKLTVVPMNQSTVSWCLMFHIHNITWVKCILQRSQVTVSTLLTHHKTLTNEIIRCLITSVQPVFRKKNLVRSKTESEESTSVKYVSLQRSLNVRITRSHNLCILWIILKFLRMSLQITVPKQTSIWI